MSPEQTPGPDGPRFAFKPSRNVPHALWMEDRTPEGQMIWAVAEEDAQEVILLVEDLRHNSVWIALGPAQVPALEAVLSRLKGLSPVPSSSKPGHPSSP